MIRKFTYNDDYIFHRHGVRKIIKHLNGIKINLYYLKEPNKDDIIVGYTKLKVYKKGKSNVDATLNVTNRIVRTIFSDFIRIYCSDIDEMPVQSKLPIENVEFEITEKKRFYQRITGYLPVGDKQFVAVVQKCLFPSMLR